MDQQEETKEQQRHTLSAWVLAILIILIAGSIFIIPHLPVDPHFDVKPLVSISLLVLLGLLMLLFKLPLPNMSVSSLITKSSTKRSGESLTKQTKTRRAVERNEVKTKIILQPSKVFPFKASLVDSREFYGRAFELKQLLDRIHHSASTSIIGPRRIGKTWLAQYVKLVVPTELGSNFQIGYLDVTLPSCWTVKGFVEEAVKALSITDLEYRGVSDLAMLQKAVEVLIAKRKTPILCLDEFEGFLMNQDFDANFFTGLRAIASMGLVLVTCSKRPLGDLVRFNNETSPFVNIFQKITLGPFNFREASTFIQAKAKQASFTEKEQATLLHYACVNKQEWPPVRLQIVGKTILEDKMKAAYHPDDGAYWTNFKRWIEKQYQEAIID